MWFHTAEEFDIQDDEESIKTALIWKINMKTSEVIQRTNKNLIRNLTATILGRPSCPSKRFPTSKLWPGGRTFLAVMK